MSLTDEVYINRLKEAGFINPEKAYTKVKWRLLDGLTIAEAVLYGVDDKKIDAALGAYEEGYYL